MQKIQPMVCYPTSTAVEIYTRFKETEGVEQVWDQAKSSPQMRCERHLFQLEPRGEVLPYCALNIMESS